MEMKSVTSDSDKGEIPVKVSKVIGDAQWQCASVDGDWFGEKQRRGVSEAVQLGISDAVQKSNKRRRFRGEFWKSFKIGDAGY